MLLRLNNRYTEDELDLMTDSIGHSPVFLDQSEKDGLIATTKMIRSYISDWKRSPQDTGMFMDLDKYKDIMEECDATLEGLQAQNQDSSKPVKAKETNNIATNVALDEWHVHAKDIEVNASTFARGSGRGIENEVVIHLEAPDNSDLPTLSGGCLKKDKSKFVGVPNLLDTGSSACLTSYSYIKSLGYTMQDLNTNTKYRIKTAHKNTPCLGTIYLDIWIKSAKGDFYRVHVELLVIEEEISKIILGWNFLNKLSFNWKKVNVGTEIVLRVYSHAGKLVHRKFVPNQTARMIKMYNTEKINAHSSEPTHVRFKSFTYIDSQNASYWPENDNMFLLTHDMGQMSADQVEYHLLGSKEDPLWPCHSYMIFACDVLFENKRSYSKDTLQMGAVALEGDVEEYIHELDNLEIPRQHPCTIQDMDDYLFDSISIFPNRDYDSKKLFYDDILTPINEVSSSRSEDPGVRKTAERPYYEPKVSHLHGDQQDLYRKLFLRFKSSMSEGKHHVGKCTLPPIKLNIPENSAVFDPVRTFSEREYEIIDKYVSEMSTAGIIEPGDPSSPWNSNLLLVSTHSEHGSRHPTTIADKVSRQEMLDKLAQASRCTLDFRRVNSRLPLLHSTVTLPSLHELLPSFCNKFVSKVDLSKAFFALSLDKASRDCTSFRVKDKVWRFKRLPMGFHSSPGCFVAHLAKIINEASFETYKAKYPELANVKFSHSFLTYVDDIAIVSRKDDRTHYLLWQFILEQFSKFGLIVNLHKSSILEHKTTEYLGVSIDTESNTYTLTPDRAQAIASWEYPLTKRAAISRLATLNYFRNLIPSMKALICNLMALCRDEVVYQPTLVHVKEFQWMQLLASLQIRLTLPDMSKPILLATDASHLSYSGHAFQWILDSEMGVMKCEHTPVCPTAQCKYKIQEMKDKFPDVPRQCDIDQNTFQDNSPFDLPPPGSSYHYQLVGCTSKTFPQSSRLSPISLKELHAILHIITYFSVWIRNCILPTILFSDVQFINYLTRMKATSSKVYSVAVFLATFPRLYIYYFKGAAINYLCDLFTRQEIDEVIKDDYGIPKEVLEPRKTLDPGRILITPSFLFRLTQAELPSEYTNTPYRRIQKNFSLPSLEEIRERWNSPTNEEKVLRLIWHGREAVNLKDYAFLSKNNKIMNKTQLDQAEKKNSIPEIRGLLRQVTKTSYHVDCKSFDQISTLSRQFVNSLYKFMKNSEFGKLEPTLFSLCQDYLKQVNVTKEDLYDIITRFYASCLLNSNVEIPDTLTQLVACEMSADSEITLKTTDNQNILLVSTKQVRLEPNQPSRLTLGLSFSACQDMELTVSLPSHIIYHLATQYQGTQTLFHTLYVLNTSEDVYTINDQNVLGFIDLRQREGPRMPISVVVYQTESQVPPRHKLLLLDLFNLCFESTLGQYFRDKDLDHYEMDLDSAHLCLSNKCNCVQINNVDKKPVVVHQESQILNRLILLSALLNQGKGIDIQIIKDLQKSDADLRQVFKLLEAGHTKQFTLKKGLLFKQEKDRWLLCVDSKTLQFIAESVHTRGMHISDKILCQHLSNSYFHPRLKSIVRDVTLSCGSCLVQQRSYQRKFINVAPEVDSLLGSELSIDLIENFPYSSHKRYKYIFICVERISCLLFAEPCQSTSADEMIRCTLKSFVFFNVPKRLRSDFSSAFSSSEFNQFLDDYHVQHIHEVPRSSQSNGLVERSVSLYRELLTKQILGEDPEARLNWPAFIDRCTLTYNNACIPYYKNQALTRYALYHSNFVYQNPKFISSLPDESPEGLARLQHVSLRNLINRRRQNQKRYNEIKQEDYVLGQLVTHVLPKSDLTSVAGGTAAQPNCSNFYTIEELLPTAARVVNIRTGDRRVLKYIEIKPIGSEHLFYTLGRLPTDPNKFLKSVYTRGNKSLLQSIAEKADKSGSSIQEEISRMSNDEPVLPSHQDIDSVEQGPDLEVLSEPVAPGHGHAQVEAAGEVGQLRPLGVQLDPEPQSDNHSYNLRKRKNIKYSYNTIRKSLSFVPKVKIRIFDIDHVPSRHIKEQQVDLINEKPRYILELYACVIYPYELSGAEQFLGIRQETMYSLDKSRIGYKIGKLEED